MDSSNAQDTASTPIYEAQGTRIANKGVVDSDYKRIAFTAILWLVSGSFLLINNFFPIPIGGVLVFLIFVSIYQLVLSAYKLIPKIYFVLGWFAFAFFVKIIIDVYEIDDFETEIFDLDRIVWPLVMVIICMGIVLYGLLFKRKKIVKYLVVGITLFAIDIMIFVDVLSGEFTFSDLLVKSWPLLLIFIGGHSLYMRKHINDVAKHKH